MYWMAWQMTITAVLSFNLHRAICHRCDAHALWACPAGDAKFFPHLALVFAIEPHSVMSGGRANIWPHHRVLIGIDTTITDDTRRSHRPLKAEQVTVAMA